MLITCFVPALAQNSGIQSYAGIGNFPQNPIANQTMALDNTTGLLYLFKGGLIGWQITSLSTPITGVLR